MGMSIEILKRRRGDERVTFGDVADHLADYLRDNRDDEDTIERLARFLARIEDEPHAHEEAPGPGSTVDAAPI